jgi:predicted esterase
VGRCHVPKEPQTRRIAAAVHGCYRVEAPAPGGGPAPLLVGFHGYAETAADQLEALRSLPGHSRFLRCAVQALHPFYNRRTGEVVASWMTRLDRDLAIEDNVRYVADVVAAVKDEFSTRDPLVYVGFSQGAAMAYRAAARAGHRCHAVVVLGGDLPRELREEDLAGLPPVLIGRGATDPWYGEEMLAADVERLRGSAVAVDVCRFDGGHEWAPAFRRAAGRLLASLPAPAAAPA